MADLTECLTLRLTPLLSHMMCPSMKLLLALVMSLNVQVEKKWRRVVHEELQGFDHDEDEPLLPSTSSPNLIPASTLEA
jgi:hypothetical protein